MKTRDTSVQDSVAGHPIQAAGHVDHLALSGPRQVDTQFWWGDQHQRRWNGTVGCYQPPDRGKANN